MPQLSRKTVCMVAAVVEVPNTSGMGSGGSTHAVEVLKGFQRNNITVTLFCARGRGQPPSEKRGITCIQRIFRWRKTQNAAPPIANVRAASMRTNLLEPLKVVFRTLRSIHYSLQILVRLRGQKIDVVYERTSGSTLAGTLVALGKKAKLICEMNDLAYNGLSLRLARHIITPNADVLPEAFRSKCITMPWGVDVHHFSPRQINEKLETELRTKNKRVILFTGSCLPWHGLLDFVNTAEILCKRHDDICFLIVGDGPTRTIAEELVLEKQLTEQFRFTGFIAYDILPNYMSLAEVAVAPYTSELSGSRAKIASPLKVLEYMAMGLPTVVSESGNHQGFIDSAVHGLIFAPGDVAQMAAAISHLLSDPTEGAEMGIRARKQCVSLYSWEAHCDAISKLVGGID
jgi:glycosyltransferase involved in cell wall biosynthesis